MLCQKCADTENVREIAVTDLRESPPGTETWGLCLRCLMHKGYWCPYHDRVKDVLLDPSQPSADLPYAIRLACAECCREKTEQLPDEAALRAVAAIERTRPDLVGWLEVRAGESGLPPDMPQAKRLSFGLVLTSEFYRMPLERTVAELSRQAPGAESRSIH